MTQPNDLSQVFACGVKECRMPSTCKLNGACVAGEMTAIESPTPAEARGEVEEVDRFDPGMCNIAGEYGDMDRNDGGDYVLYDDYATLARQLAEAKAEIDQRTAVYGLVVGSVCAALKRAGFDDCDDPGEAIDVMRENYEAQLAQATAQLAAVEGLIQQWRDGKDIDGYNAPSDARQWMRDCADELEIALKQKEPTHAPE